MNIEIIAGIVILLAILAVFVWQEWKGKNMTKAVATVLTNHAATIDAKLVDYKEHFTNTIEALEKTVGLTSAPAPVVVPTTADAAHATLDAQIAAAQQTLADLQAKKDAVTKAQQALNEAVGAVKS